MTHNVILQRIEAIDAQLVELRRMRRSGDLMGAGLGLALCIGPMHAKTAKPVTIEMGMSAGAVRVARHRAVAAMRDCLEGRP